MHAQTGIELLGFFEMTANVWSPKNHIATANTTRPLAKMIPCSSFPHHFPARDVQDLGSGLKNALNDFTLPAPAFRNIIILRLHSASMIVSYTTLWILATSSWFVTVFKCTLLLDLNAYVHFEDTRTYGRTIFYFCPGRESGPLLTGTCNLKQYGFRYITWLLTRALGPCCHHRIC